MLKENNKNKSLGLKTRPYSIVNIGSVQSYLGIPYRSACKTVSTLQKKLKFLLSNFITLTKIAQVNTK